MNLTSIPHAHTASPKPQIFHAEPSLLAQVKAITGPWTQTARRCSTMATSDGRGRGEGRGAPPHRPHPREPGAPGEPRRRSWGPWAAPPPTCPRPRPPPACPASPRPWAPWLAAWAPSPRAWRETCLSGDRRRSPRAGPRPPAPPPACAWTTSCTVGRGPKCEGAATLPSSYRSLVPARVAAGGAEPQTLGGETGRPCPSVLPAAWAPNRTGALRPPWALKGRQAGAGLPLFGGEPGALRRAFPVLVRGGPSSACGPFALQAAWSRLEAQDLPSVFQGRRQGVPGSPCGARWRHFTSQHWGSEGDLGPDTWRGTSCSRLMGGRRAAAGGRGAGCQPFPGCCQALTDPVVGPGAPGDGRSGAQHPRVTGWAPVCSRPSPQLPVPQFGPTLPPACRGA